MTLSWNEFGWLPLWVFWPLFMFAVGIFAAIQFVRWLGISRAIGSNLVLTFIVGLMTAILAFYFTYPTPWILILMFAAFVACSQTGYALGCWAFCRLKCPAFLKPFHPLSSKATLLSASALLVLYCALFLGTIFWYRHDRELTVPLSGLLVISLPSIVFWRWLTSVLIFSKCEAELQNL